MVAKILNEIADILEMKDVEFKPRAYRKAARTIESISRPIEEFYESGELQKLSGVGKSIALKISEIIETGTSSYYEQLKTEIPVDIEELNSIEGMGPKTIEILYQTLGVKTLQDLENAAREHKIREIKGLGSKTEENILDHIELAKRKKERMLLGQALPIAEELKNRLKKELTLFHVFAIATGTTLSAGFFLLPGLVANYSGPAVPLAYLIAVLPLIPAMFSIIELSTAMPKAGGVYYFLDRTLGPLIGTIGGFGTWAALGLKVAFALIGMGAYIK
ncbi:MAG: amino acid permease, partial [Candidatus Bathyarchaeota archaeon]